MEQQNLFDESTDTDWADFRKSMKEAGQKKRTENLNDSLRMLAEIGIDFTSNNQGVHCVIEDHGHVWDFWPSTGKYARRNKDMPQAFKRGVNNLIVEVVAARPKAK